MNIIVAGACCFDMSGKLTHAEDFTIRDGRKYLVTPERVALMIRNNGRKYFSKVEMSKAIALGNGRRGIPIDEKVDLHQAFELLETDNSDWVRKNGFDHVLEVMLDRIEGGGGAFNSLVSANSFLHGKVCNRDRFGELYNLKVRALMMHGDQDLKSLLPDGAEWDIVCEHGKPGRNLVLNIQGKKLIFREPTCDFCGSCIHDFEIHDPAICQMNSIKSLSYSDFLEGRFCSKGGKFSLAATDSMIKSLGVDKAQSIAAKAEVYISNLDELKVLAEMEVETNDDLIKAMRRVWNAGSRIYVTLNGNGALVMDSDGNAYYQSTTRGEWGPLGRQIIATTSKAGDTFNGVMLCLEAAQFATLEILDYANAAAQRFVMFGYPPTPDGVREFRREYGRPYIKIYDEKQGLFVNYTKVNCRL